MAFFDLSKTDYCESMCQGCFYWSRPEVRGSNTIRYHPSLNHGWMSFSLRLLQHLGRYQSLWVPYGREAETQRSRRKGTTRSGACGLTLTQHEAYYLLKGFLKGILFIKRHS